MKSGGPLKRSELKRGKPLARKPSKQKRRPVSAASPPQRSKVAAHLFCIACGAERSDYVTLDPAHLCPRGRGGCDDPECVVPLCRSVGGGCHALFDAGELDLTPMLEPRHRDEVAHCVLHLGLFGTVRRLTGDRGYGERAA